MYDVLDGLLCTHPVAFLPLALHSRTSQTALSYTKLSILEAHQRRPNARNPLLDARHTNRQRLPQS